MAVQADKQSQCEEESSALKGTLHLDSFVKDCIDSANWSTTLDIQANAWYKCKEGNKLSDYHECLNNNRIYRESMIASFDCYYTELDVLSLEGYNKYRYAKSDALYYNASDTRFYEVYSKCLDGKGRPADTKDSVTFYECVAQHIYDEGSSLMLKEWKQSPNYNQDFEECKKSIPKELITNSILNTPLSKDFVPYSKCVFGRMGMLDNDCFYVDRLVEATKKLGISSKMISACFNKAIGESDLDIIGLWNCLVENNVIEKLQT